MPPKRKPTAPGGGSGSNKAQTDGDKGCVVFFHPDLGIGGAERLVVDAAVGLQERGHRVVVYTNHCDPSHCFDECRDGTLDVRVRGSWLIPPSIRSRLAILCAVLRHVHLIAHVTLTGELARLRPRALFVDQLSAGLPLLRYLHDAVPVLFYCHFPDLLLVRGRRASLLKRLYRVPFDWLERWSMGFAHAVAVNSEFTRSVVDDTWPGFRAATDVRVVYPCVDVSAVRREEGRDSWEDALSGQGRILLSINRFERKKDIGLAIRAFAAVPEAERAGVRLVLAGGYDPRVSENVEYHTELQHLASSLGIAHHTIANPDSPAALSSSSSSATSTATSSSPSEANANATPPPILFLLSVPGALKAALLSSCHAVLYTPSGEHFGIVPLEAMLAQRPVIAADSGGPVETIRDGHTGWLRDPRDARAWTDAVRHALRMSDADVARMGAHGARRVKETFGRDNMAESLDAIISDISSRKTRPPRINYVVNMILLVIFFFAGLGLATMYRRLRT